MHVELDHLVVAAATLEDGVAWCEATLGLTPGPGGRHAHMGTHNRLLALGGAAFPQAYFEIIAIDPEAAPPARPRWFDLDSDAMRARLAHGPQLVHWVARSTHMDGHRQGLADLGLQPGTPLPAHRDTPAGRLAWQTLVRDDGALLLGGALPTLIQWDGPHPTTRMPDSRLVLRSLVLRGLPARVRELLRPAGVSCSDDAPGPGAPALAATFDTPRGTVTITSDTPTPTP